VTDAPADIAAFVAEFESGRLPKSRWTHEAHLLVALWYLAQHDEAAALPIVRQRIRAYNEAVGTVNSDHGGYHESLTRLYLRGIAAHRAAHPAPSLAAAYAALLGTPIARRDWPLSYYSKARLFSVEARRGWVEPDLRSLP
jgi:hypothetical protein